MPTIHEQRLQQIQSRLGELEDAFKPHHDKQIEIALEVSELTTEAWGCKIADMFPSHQIEDRSLLATVTMKDNLNKADDLGAALHKSGSRVTNIEHDPLRQEYRIYGIPADRVK
jgi:hypothetical protein